MKFLANTLVGSVLLAIMAAAFDAFGRFAIHVIGPNVCPAEGCAEVGYMGTGMIAALPVGGLLFAAYMAGDVVIYGIDKGLKKRYGGKGSRK